MTPDRFLMTAFERVYIINLPERGDRRAEVARQFDRIGHPVDGDRVRFFTATRPADKGPFPSIGARGCFMSHLRVLEDALAAGLDSVLICEDDLDFAPDLATRDLAGDAAAGGADWRIFYGGYESLATSTRAAARDGFAIVPPVEAIRTTHCLGLRGGAIADCASYLRRMLARPAGDPAGGPMHVDGAYSWFRRENSGHVTVATVPPIGLQRASRSDIADVAWYDRVTALAAVLRVLRRVKKRMRA